VHIKFVFGNFKGRDHCGDIDNMEGCVFGSTASGQGPGHDICEHVMVPVFIQRQQDSKKLTPVKDKIKCMHSLWYGS
jgi:hypothetical protein